MTESDLNALLAKIDELRDEMIRTMCDMVRIPALGPLNDGDGELEKAEWLQSYIGTMGFDEIKRYDAPDDAVPSKIRPNIVAILKGKDSSRRLWIVTHTDIVPPGDLELWETDPYEPVIKDGKIYARGVEDNGQELIASLFAAKAFMELGIKPEMDVYLAFVADEETNSVKGIRYLVEQGLFREDDLIVVPDGGNSKGALLEVAEKSIMWIKVKVVGQQCHASMPHLGKNAFKVSMRFGCALEEELKGKYPLKNDMYDVPFSTFEPTKKEVNVPNINTIPGEDIFYIDCRVLPEYDTDEIISFMQSIADKVGQETGTSITVEAIQHEKATAPTPPDSPIVELLRRAVNNVYSNEPYAGGIGGGTCAAIFRRAGYKAVVWGKIDDTCHMPNEYTVIDNLVNDAKVYVNLFLS